MGDKGGPSLVLILGLRFRLWPLTPCSGPQLVRILSLAGFRSICDTWHLACLGVVCGGALVFRSCWRDVHHPRHAPDEPD